MFNHRRQQFMEHRLLSGYGNMVEVIPGKLYWMAVDQPRQAEGNVYHFNCDRKFIYEGFFEDFGPLNLACTWEYIMKIRELLDKFPEKKIVHYTSAVVGHISTNCACLMACYMTMDLGMSPDAVIKRFQDAGYSMANHEMIPYRDATCGECPYPCTIRDVCEGLGYAKKIGWFNMETFNHDDYRWCESVANGDFNWIIPGKFIAFAGPLAKDIDNDGYRMCTPELYKNSFTKRNVTCVVRLNRKQYESRRFTQMGMKHVDMYFLDGSCPPTEIWKKFLRLTEEQQGAVAVHCKAGLGRTGTLIGLFAMKHYGFPPRGWIGWNRLCRPGSILGPQQQWLSEIAATIYNEPGSLTMAPELTKN